MIARGFPGRAAALLVAVAAVACSRGAAPPDRALEMCRRGSGDVASARLTTVAEVRALRAGPGQAAPSAFPGSNGDEAAAWCWTRDRDGWRSYAVGPGDTVVPLARIEGLPGTPSGPPLLP